MMALLSLLLGFLSPSLKDIVGLWKNKQDNAQELALAQLQIDANKEIGQQKLEEIRMTQDSADLVTRYTPARTSKFAANLNEITRSIVCLGIFSIYCLTKYVLSKELDAANDPALFASIMWCKEDFMIMFAILGFYVGSTQKEIRAT